MRNTPWIERAFDNISVITSNFMQHVATFISQILGNFFFELTGTFLKTLKLVQVLRKNSRKNLLTIYNKALNPVS